MNPKASFTRHPSIRFHAAMNPNVRKIVSSPKWAILVYPYNSANPDQFNHLLRQTINDFQVLTKYIQKESTLRFPILDHINSNAEWIQSLVRLEQRGGLKNLYSAEVMEEIFDDVLKAKMFFHSAKTKIEERLTGYSFGYRSEEGHLLVDENKNRDASNIELLRNIKTHSDLLLKIIKEITYNTPFVPNKGNEQYKKWEKEIIRYYLNKLKIDPNCLDLPPGYTIKIAEDDKKNHLRTINIYAKKSNQKDEQPSPWKLDPQISEQPTQFPETTQKLLQEIEEKQTRTSYLYTELTPEEQHTIDSIFTTHIPEVLGTLKTIIKIQSTDIPEATKQCNQVIRQALAQIETIITKTEKALMNKLNQETKSITNILNHNTITK